MSIKTKANILNNLVNIGLLLRHMTTDVVNKFVDGKGKKTEENLEGLY